MSDINVGGGFLAEIRDNGIAIKHIEGGLHMAHAGESAMVLEIERLRAQVADLQENGQRLKEIADAGLEEIKELRAALTDAIESVESLASYADGYYKKKHDLAGDLARLRAAL